MEKIAATERAKFQNEEPLSLQDWERLQAAVAAETDLAILLVEGHQPPQLAISNNNSICHAFQTSTTHAHLCDPYCGAAFQRAHEAGETTHYRCHAGLHCFAMPVGQNTKRPLAIIGGRAFLSSADYRELAERFRSGDLRELLSTELFRNVIFAARHNLDELAAQLVEVLVKAKMRGAATTDVELSQKPRDVPIGESAGEEKRASGVAFPPGTTLEAACANTIEKLRAEFKLKSVAFMMRNHEGFTPACATGKFKNKPPQISAKGKTASAHLRLAGKADAGDAAGGA